MINGIIIKRAICFLLIDKALQVVPACILWEHKPHDVTHSLFLPYTHRLNTCVRTCWSGGNKEHSRSSSLLGSFPAHANSNKDIFRLDWSNPPSKFDHYMQVQREAATLLVPIGFPLSLVADITVHNAYHWALIDMGDSFRYLTNFNSFLSESAIPAYTAILGSYSYLLLNRHFS